MNDVVPNSAARMLSRRTCLKAGLLLAGAAALPRVSAAAFEMKAGTAKGMVTPDKLLKLTAGKLNDGTMLDADGKEHDLFARVLVLNDGLKRLVIVTYDMNSLDVATPILRERCRNELGVDAPYLLLLCTHNHQAPMPRWKENFPHQRWLAERIFALIKEAIAAERGPATLLLGSGNGYFLRSSGNAPADYEIQLLKVMRGKDTVALLFNHPVHPFHSSRTKIGAGHPGYALDELERDLPGTLPLYADACGANQFVVPGEGMYKSVEKCRQFGSLLAKAVKDILAREAFTEVTGPITSRMEVLSLPLASPPSYQEALALAKGIPLDIGYDHGVNRGTNWIRALLRHYHEGIPFPTKTGEYTVNDEGYVVEGKGEPRAFPCHFEEVIAARIGPMPLVALQGEVCAPIGMRVKDAFRFERPIMVFAYMGEHNIYIPTREIVRLDDYQSQVIRIQYASPCGWAPEVEDETVAGTVALVKRALGEGEKK
jgi:hypothetical protein